MAGQPHPRAQAPPEPRLRHRQRRELRRHRPQPHDRVRTDHRTGHHPPRSRSGRHHQRQPFLGWARSNRRLESSEGAPSSQRRRRTRPRTDDPRQRRLKLDRGQPAQPDRGTPRDVRAHPRSPLARLATLAAIRSPGRHRAHRPPRRVRLGKGRIRRRHRRTRRAVLGTHAHDPTERTHRLDRGTAFVTEVA